MTFPKGSDCICYRCKWLEIQKKVHSKKFRLKYHWCLKNYVFHEWISGILMMGYHCKAVWIRDVRRSTTNIFPINNHFPAHVAIWGFVKRSIHASTNILCAFNFLFRSEGQHNAVHGERVLQVSDTKTVHVRAIVKSEPSNDMSQCDSFEIGALSEE